MAEKKGKKDTRVKAVSEKETIITNDMNMLDSSLERRINGEEIENLRMQNLSLEMLMEHVIRNAIKRQEQAGKDTLNVSITFDLIDNAIIVQDDSVGLNLEDFSSLVLETRFGHTLSGDGPSYNEDLSLLELAAYFGEEFELLTVSKNLTKWVTVNFNDVLNLEQVDLVSKKEELDKKQVKKLVPSTGVRYVIKQPASEFSRGRATYPTTPASFHKLRIHLRNSFESTMDKMDLEINLNFRSKIKAKKKGLFRKN